MRGVGGAGRRGEVYYECYIGAYGGGAGGGVYCKCYIGA